MADFRIKLKISDHFGFFDARTSSWIFVSSSMSTIQDLQNHISKLFEIEGNYYLVLKGNLLHPMENVKVLQHGDVVTAKKGSFLPAEDVPKKEIYFERIKKSFRDFGDRVSEFLAIFEQNTQSLTDSSRSEEVTEICVQSLAVVVEKEPSAQDDDHVTTPGSSSDQVVAFPKTDEEKREVTEISDVESIDGFYVFD